MSPASECLTEVRVRLMGRSVRYLVVAALAVVLGSIAASCGGDEQTGDDTSTSITLVSHGPKRTSHSWWSQTSYPAF